MSLAKKLKSIIKGEPQPASFGKDPNEPWSVRAGITESEAGMLSAYLKSRGINPEFVSKDTKISHAKSGDFKKWKKDHQFEEVEYIAEDGMLLQYLKAKGINPAYVTKDQKIAYAKSNAFIKWKQQHMHEQVVKTTPTQAKQNILKKKEHEGKPVHEGKQPTALERFRSALSQRDKEAKERETEMEKRHASGKEDMKGSIDRLEKSLNKEEVEHKVGDSVTVHSKFFGKQKGKVTKVDGHSIHVQRDGKKQSEKYPHEIGRAHV